MWMDAITVGTHRLPPYPLPPFDPTPTRPDNQLSGYGREFQNDVGDTYDFTFGRLRVH